MSVETMQAVRNLRNLYFTRSAVQVVWAAAVITMAATNPALGVVLLVLYPLWDVACTLYDLKGAAESGAAKTQVVNAIAGVLTAVGAGITAYAHPQYAVAIFGAWALVAGLLQLAVGIQRRRRLGGQWAMILSGTQSTAAGVAFVLTGLSGKTHVKDLGGYAVFGAIYFLISGMLLSRRLAKMEA